METTLSIRVTVEIRRFSKKPVYFKSGFLGGSMVRDVLILNPDSTDYWMCVRADSMRKLPTRKWCEEIIENPYEKIAMVSSSRPEDPGEVVWKGLVSTARINALKRLFEIDDEATEVFNRRIQGYGRASES